MKQCFARWASPICKSRPDRAACARYGLNVGDVAAIVQAAIGGQAVTQVLEGDRRFDLVVRWKPQYRESLDAIRQIRVNLPAGGQVPLDQVANIETAEGASFIYREALQRYVPVRFSVRGRDLQSTIVDAKQRDRAGGPASRGRASGMVGRVRRTAGGQSPLRDRGAVRAVADHRRALRARLNRSIDTFIIMAQIPVACLGGVLGADHHRHAVQRLGRRRLHFDFRHRGDGRHPAELLHPPALGGGPSVRRVDHHGLRPALRATMMTDLVDALGLLPAAISTRIGAQTQRPLAIVVIGGALAIMLLTRILQPVLIYLCHRRLRLDDQNRSRLTQPIPVDLPTDRRTAATTYQLASRRVANRGKRAEEDLRDGIRDARERLRPARSAACRRPRPSLLQRHSQRRHLSAQSRRQRRNADPEAQGRRRHDLQPERRARADRPRPDSLGREDRQEPRPVRRMGRQADQHERSHDRRSRQRLHRHHQLRSAEQRQADSRQPVPRRSARPRR